MAEWKAKLPETKPLIDFNSTSSSDLLSQCHKVGCDFFFSENSYLEQIMEKQDISGWNITDCSNNCSPLNLIALQNAGIRRVTVDSIERIKSLKESPDAFVPVLQVAVTKSLREMGCSMDKVTSVCEEATKMGVQLDGLCFLSFEDRLLSDLLEAINSALESATAGGQKIRKVMIIGAGIQPLRTTLCGLLPQKKIAMDGVGFLQAERAFDD